MTLSFNAIPLDLRTPGSYVEIDSSRARSGLPIRTPRVLLMGSMLPEGNFGPNLPVRILNAAEGVTRFGRGSVLAAMIAAFMAANASAEVHAIGITDLAGGVQATGTVTFTAPATVNGTLSITVAGLDLSMPVVAGEAVATLGPRLAALINGGLDLPLVASAAAGVVTLTARHKGPSGNLIDVRFNALRGDQTPQGLVATIVPMSGGVGDPSTSLALAAIGDMVLDGLVTAFSGPTYTTALTTEFESRWGPGRMLDGIVFAATTGTIGTLAAYGAALNSPYLSALGFERPLTTPWETAAVYAGVVLHYGGIDPARPFQTLPLPGVRAPAEADRPTRAEREALLRDGISTWTVDAGGQVVLERPITTYQVDAAGNPDTAWLDLNTVLTLSYLRFSLRARIAAKYPRHKLGDDGGTYGIGQPIVTPKVLRAEVLAWFRDLEDAGLVENVDQFKADLIIERDPSDANRVNALIPPDIINQFRVFAAQIQFRL